MVVQRTIQNLQNRPRDERAAVAAAIAIGVGILLFIGWAASFFNSVRGAAPAAEPVQTHGNTNTAPDQFGSYGELQLQQTIQTTSTPYQAGTSSWGN